MKMAERSQAQYKNSLKELKKAQKQHDKSLLKSSILKSVEKCQKEKMQKQAIANCSKEDYQKNVSYVSYKFYSLTLTLCM